MKELVDTIISIDFNEINDVLFPMDELFGLVVNFNNVKYEFLINLVENSDFLLSVGSGAFNKNTKHDRNRPWFNRWSWGFKDSRIFYNDPTLYLASDIYGPWCVGTKEEWYLENIAKIIEAIAKKIGIPNNHMIFFGSSSGGFTSLYFSIIIKNSIALAEIPQFDITQWGDHWKPIKNASFSSMTDDEFIEEYGYRLKVLDFIHQMKFIPNAYIICDCSAQYDFEKQYVPFFNELNKLPFNKDTNTMKLIILGKNEGHAPSPAIYILKLIEDIKLSCYTGVGIDAKILSTEDNSLHLIEENANLKKMNKQLTEVIAKKNVEISCLNHDIHCILEGTIKDYRENIPEDVLQLQVIIDGKNNIINYLNGNIDKLNDKINKQNELLESYQKND